MVFIFVCIDIQLSRVQPPQYEMEEYILRVAEQFKLREKTRFQTEINKFEWDDVNGEWTLYAHDVKTGQRILHKSKLLLACQGGLVHPLQLQAEGLENFKGHTCTRLFGIILLTSKGKKSL